LGYFLLLLSSNLGSSNLGLFSSGYFLLLLSSNLELFSSNLELFSSGYFLLIELETNRITKWNQFISIVVASSSLSSRFESIMNYETLSFAGTFSALFLSSHLDYLKSIEIE
jgi:hypothetical protein